MRSLAIAAFALLAAGSAPPLFAAPPAAAAAPVATPPKVFLAEGYTQPDIGPSACRNLDAQRTICTIPAMTAGSYYAEALGTSTATVAGAAQQLTIAAGDQSCSATRREDP